MEESSEQSSAKSDLNLKLDEETKSSKPYGSSKKVFEVINENDVYPSQMLFNTVKVENRCSIVALYGHSVS